MPKIVKNDREYTGSPASARNVTFDKTGAKNIVNSANTQDAVLELDNAVDKIKQSFQDGCSTIASAISDMGVATAYNDSPEIMAENIRNIINNAFEDVSYTLTTSATNDSTTSTKYFIFNIPKNGATLNVSFKVPTNNGSGNYIEVYGKNNGTTSGYGTSLGKIVTASNAGTYTGTMDVFGYETITLKIYCTHSGNAGHSATASYTTTVDIKEFANNLYIYKVSLGSVDRSSSKELSINLADYYRHYADITKDNIIVQVNSYVVPSTASTSSSTVNGVSYSYEPGAGTLKITANSQVMWSSTATNNKVDIYIIDKYRDISDGSFGGGVSGFKLKNYVVSFSCSESGQSGGTDGIGRSASSSFDLDVSDSTTLYIGSYTTTTNSSHGNGAPTAALTCKLINNDGTETSVTVGKSGTSIDVSNASTVSITGKFTSNTGASYSVSGTINVSQIIVS